MDVAGFLRVLKRLGRGAAVAATLALGAAQAAELVIATSRTPLSLPLFVADANGYFAAEGASVRLDECTGGQRCIRKLFEGAAALASTSDLPVMFNSFARSDFAIVATFVTSSSDLKLVARATSGIKTHADLQGKRIGTVKGASAHYFLDALLLFHDIDPQRVEIVNLRPEDTSEALRSRQVDAVAIWEPNAWTAMRTIGAVAVVLPSPRIYTESFNLVAHRAVLQEREPDVVRVLRALAQAQRFISTNPREAKDILKRRLGLNDEFVSWAWSDLDFRLGLDQSLVTTLEAEARWAIREGHVPAGSRTPNYLQFVEPGPLRKALPGEGRILR